MGPLPKQKHEQFCQGLVSGLSATKAYTAVYGPGPGNASSANRLRRDAQISNRIKELIGSVNEMAEERLVDRAVSDLRKRETRIAWLDDLARRQRATFEARGKAYDKTKSKNGKMVEVPGGKEGLVVPSPRGLSDRLVWKADTEFMKEHRATLQQIAQECGDWTDKRENRFTDEAGRDRPFTLADADRLLHGG